jgi:hypothetical protein
MYVNLYPYDSVRLVVSKNYGNGEGIPGWALRQVFPGMRKEIGWSRY